jgi:hypothetical protein
MDPVRILDLIRSSKSLRPKPAVETLALPAAARLQSTPAAAPKETPPAPKGT